MEIPKRLEELYLRRSLRLFECEGPLREYWSGILRGTDVESSVIDLFAALRALVDEKIAAGDIPESHRERLFRALEAKERSFLPDLVDLLAHAELGAFPPLP